MISYSAALISPNARKVPKGLWEVRSCLTGGGTEFKKLGGGQEQGKAEK